MSSKLNIPELATKVIDQWDGTDMRALVERAVADGINAERQRWRQALGYGLDSACACSGCPHEANCFCNCPTCMFADSLRYERERLAKVANSTVKE